MAVVSNAELQKFYIMLMVFVEIVIREKDLKNIDGLTINLSEERRLNINIANQPRGKRFLIKLTINIGVL